MFGKLGVPPAASETITVPDQEVKLEFPVVAKILGGRVHGDSAVLRVEGRDRDEILRRGRIEMVKVDGTWRYSQADLDSVDE